MKRVKHPHGLLPKVPLRGDKIVVIAPYGDVAGVNIVLRALVRRSTGGRKIEHRIKGRFPIEVTENVPHQSRGGTVYRRDEGVTWARGWDTKEADALRVSVAL